jgi:hypothetical protein
MTSGKRSWRHGVADNYTRVQDSLASPIDSQRREAEIKALKFAEDAIRVDLFYSRERIRAEIKRLSGDPGGTGVSSERKEPNAAL